uniref:non-specific serine/threonine protein kinase n=1 Tax=Steinernema glaseri TaxID=37863 RepID=A0A1I7Y7H9_9BILA
MEAATTDDAPLTFKPGQKFGQWRICSKVDEGGFGQVYKVEHIKEKGRFAALKAEPNEAEGGSAIKLEIAIMLMMNRKGDIPHIPVVLHSARRKRYCYMIVTLLGENLKTLKMTCKDDRFTISTWTRIGIQTLYSLKLLHDSGFSHRDVKPANFVMGHATDADRARLVHLLDFGLARNFAVEKSNGNWVVRRARATSEFRGTVRYCSPTMHEKKEQGRKDDLWSWLYMLIEAHCGLPWQNDRDKERIETKKLNIADDVLMKNFPEELHCVPKHLRTLDYYSRPDYSMIYNALLALMKKHSIKYTDPYDWETNTSCAALLSKQSKTPAYENATEFFASDPIKINEAPPPGKDVKGNTTIEDLDAFFKIQ